jgi:enoyl-CoA hydratase/carnithine racemase
MSNSPSNRAAPMTYTRFSLVKSTPSLWRVTFDNPPINLIDAVMMKELLNLLTEIERDKRVGVVLFDSADPDFFLAHYDIAGDPAELEGVETTAGRHPFTELHIRLSKSPAVTISAIRGRARGAGSEFALATDIRFASRERAVLGQFEIGVGATPGGGALNRLSSLVGRGRAFEILVSGLDFDGELAEDTATSTARSLTSSSSTLSMPSPDGCPGSICSRSPTSGGSLTPRHFPPTSRWERR